MSKRFLIAAVCLTAALSACGRPAPLAPAAVPAAAQAVSAAAADRTGNPVICVPGFIEPAALWNHIEKHLEKQGRDVTVLKLFPHLASVEDGAKKLEKLVDDVKKRTGAKQVDLLAHSKGGLVARYYVKFNGGVEQVEHLVSIASPNHGVPVPVPAIWRTIDQVKSGTKWMKALNEPDDTPGNVKYTTFVGALDPIILPHSTSKLEGAKNFTVPLATHVSILYAKKSLELIDNALAE